MIRLEIDVLLASNVQHTLRGLLPHFTGHLVSIRLDRLHRAYPTLHPSGVVHLYQSIAEHNGSNCMGHAY